MKAVFIESVIFAKYRAELLDDDSYREFQNYLMDNPTAGDAIQGTGGLRKIRWSSNGKGKRGGVRVIYLHLSASHHIHLLTLYAKNESDDLSAETKRLLVALAQRIKDETKHSE
jgi:mRNA-degrading endonuclease RelE of RelBE toxin-antitoxin system